MKSCKKGYYYCFTDKECKKIPKGWHLMSSGQIMRDKDHEEDGEDKSGNYSNGNGNGSSDAGGDGGGVEESWSVTNEGKESGDHEVAMAQSQLAKAERNIAKLRKALGKKEKDIPAWMQAKITDTAHDTDAAAGYADKINEAVPLLAAPLVIPATKAIGAGLAATGLAGMIMQAQKKREGKNSQPVDYGQGKPKKKKDETEIGFTGKPIPKKKRSPKKQYEVEKKRRESGFTSKGRKHSNDVNPYYNPRVKEEVEQLEEARDGKSAKDKGYSLRDWFKGGGWVQAGGKYDGKPCAKQPGQKTKPFCRDADDRAAMSKDERESRAKKKRKQDPNPNRKGKAKIVTEENNPRVTGRPNNPSAIERIDSILPGLPFTYHGFKEKTRKPYKYNDPHTGPNYNKTKTTLTQRREYISGGGNAAMKDKGQTADQVRAQGRKNLEARPANPNVHNWRDGNIQVYAGNPPMRFNVKNSYELEGELVDEGKKDACYNKVKSRYSVWPSAYASGALVKCRKVGAKNWGNKTQKEDYNVSNWRDDFKAMEFEVIDIIKPEPMIGLSEKKNSKLSKIVKELRNASKMHASQADRIEKLNNVSEAKKLGSCEKNKIEKYVKGMKKNKDSFKDSYGSDAKPVMYATATKMAKKVCNEGLSNWRSELDLQEKKKKNCGCGKDPCETYGKQEVKEDWQKVNKSDRTDGMSTAAVKAYRREHPRSKLKTAVTGNPKPGSKDAKRRKSFCARSKGQQDMHNINCAKTPDKSICKARSRWKC